MNEAFFSRIPEVSLPLFSLVRTRGPLLNRDDELAALAANISQVVQVLSDDQIAILFPDDVIARVRPLPIRGQTDIFECLATSPEYKDKASFNILLMSI